ncbi:MAG TPA: PspC domain-containing protein [Acidimicrobiia bacterium]|nr:PspC domain-containing protein [Acidimicrobiia bacterium]
MTQLEAPVSERQVARLRRSQSERVIAGVCGGLGRYFGVDPVWFRLAFIILAIGGGAGVLFYVISWIAIPEEGADTNRLSGSDLGTKGPLIAGVLLVGVGLLFLADNLAPWFNQFMWPAAVIAAGLGLIYTGRRRERY